MSRKIEEAVTKLSEPIAKQLGYEVIDVEYVVKKGADNELVIYIDKLGGVDIEDCEALSRALDEPIDELDPIADSYVLCVSSPGIDRPLKNERDFERALNSEVELKLYQKINGKKELTGTLTSYDEEKIIITNQSQTLTLNRKDIAIIRPYISF